MKGKDIIEKLRNHELDEQLRNCTCQQEVEPEIERYVQLVKRAESIFGDLDYHLFSAPGRTEVGGNHTDHQRGRVLAASVNMDMGAVVAAQGNEVHFISEGFSIAPISLDDLSVQKSEVNTSEALIRGIAARFKQLGYQIGGFCVCCNSGVLPGSGISSSAAFEVLVGTILSHLYNDGKVSAVEIAQIGQYAENHYFGKPCGLMDQTACSVGGFVAIDFKDAEHPVVEKVDFDFTTSGYVMCLVDTKGDHADLSDEYGLMPKEMKDVAHVFGKEVLSEVTMEQFLINIDKVITATSDRSVLRAYHFLNETERVLEEVQALKDKDMTRFNQLIIESGYSSYMYLQNVYSAKYPEKQNLAIALAVSEQILKGAGAWRVHGGGLAGTIQAFVPHALLESYQAKMNQMFGQGSCFVLSIRPVGGYKIC